MKNKFLAVVLIILLFIPTYIGIYSYIQKEKTPVTVDTATGFEISDLDGVTFKAESSSAVALLLNRINTTATPLDTPPESLSGAKYFKVSYTEGKRSAEYRYFFSLNTDAVYYLDPDGKSYLVNPSAAAEFLETEYARSLYAEAYLPEFANGGNVIAPASYEWAYQTKGGSALHSTASATAAGTATYAGKNGLSFTFTREPKSFDIVIKGEDGKELYSGAYADLAGKIDLRLHNKLNVNATVSWAGNSEHMSSGSANYSFILSIEANPEFFIAIPDKKGAFEPGDILLVTAIGIPKGSADKITFTSSPELIHNGKKIIPKFYSDGNIAYAILPTTYETAAGDYKLNFGYEGAVYTENLTVTAKKFGSQNYEVSKQIAEASRTAKNLEAFEKLTGDIASGNFGTKYFGGVFSMGFDTAKNKVVYKGGYGYKRTVTATKDTYRQDGVDFSIKDGTDIVAMNDGRVVYAGASDYMGVVVAVDHGYGLISWYCNLGKATVKIGDTVKKNDKVGVSGSTGFTVGNRLHVKLTVFDVPVCPYDLWENELVFAEG